MLWKNRTARVRRPRTAARAGAAAVLALGLALVTAPMANGSATPAGVRATAAAPAGNTAAPAVSPPESDFFSTVQIDSGATIGAPAVGDNVNHGDLWPNCWSDDDNVYGAYGDGVGFGAPSSDIGVARVSGGVGALQGTSLAQGNAVGQVWTADHSRKRTGMACVGSTLYLAVQDLSFDFNDAPAATVAQSTDHGRTWTWNHSAPMFPGGVFTTVMFLDYGKAYANAPDGYVYAYGLDHNWRDSFTDSVPDPTDVYLARVPRASVTDRSAWQFVSGYDTSGTPTWSSDINQRVAVLHDDRHVYQQAYTAGRAHDMTVVSQGGVVYDKPLKRYIYTSWTEYTFEFYESPTPWGPWRHFETKDFGGYPWTNTKHGGYATTIPSKFISADGTSMWLQSNVCPCGGGPPGGDNWAYIFSLRHMNLVPATASTPANGKDAGRNLAREPGTVGIERAMHYGNVRYYDDGNRSETDDDWNNEAKTASWWGFAWPRQYTVDRVVHTAGSMFSDGGWFASGLRVQVRHGSTWTDAPGLSVSPAYPYNSAAGPHHTYTLSFTPTSADGVRVIGAPGGTRTFTSIAELEAYYS